MRSKRSFIVIFTVLIVALLTAITVSARGKCEGSTRVPGHCQDRYDTNENGYPDAGMTTVGVYTSVYAYDANGDWYWDLGDGRTQGTVDSIDDLDQATLTTCDYQVQYRGNFEDDPFLDSGWISNNIVCKGYDYPNAQTFNSLIVHETDPRYEGREDLSIWGTWEYHVDAWGGTGNLARPETPVGAH